MEYDQLVQPPIERDRSNYVECLYFQSAACRFGDTVCSYLFCFDSPKTRVYPTFANLLFFLRVFGKRHQKKTVVSKKKTSHQTSHQQTTNLQSTFFSPAEISQEEERGQDEDSRCAHLKSMFKHLVVVPELSEALKAGGRER